MNLEEGMDPVQLDLTDENIETERERAEMEVVDEGTDPTLCDSSDKCEHGVRKAKGDAIAIYCSGCNQGFARIMAPAKRVPELQHRERTIDASEYLEAPVWERLVDAERMEAMC